MVKTDYKYYSFHSTRGVYIVERTLRKGTKSFFGYFKTEDGASLAVQLFNKYGWDKKNMWRVKYEVKQKIKGEV